jgi:hypothetical protein
MQIGAKGGAKLQKWRVEGLSVNRIINIGAEIEFMFKGLQVDIGKVQGPLCKVVGNMITGELFSNWKCHRPCLRGCEPRASLWPMSPSWTHGRGRLRTSPELVSRLPRWVGARRECPGSKRDSLSTS